MSLVTQKYNPDQMSERELEATFAARGHTVEFLLKSLHDQIHSGTLSSFVLTGPRGAGKSTVIHMVVLRIRQDTELSRAWMPVLFPEEQYNLTSLRDLLVAVLRNISMNGWPNAQTWADRADAEPNNEQSQQLAITGLKELTRLAGKRLVVFVENLNLLLEESLDKKMKGTLRRLLMTDPFMMLIASSVHVFDSLKKYDEAFFNYFGQVPLDRLTAEQVFELLRLRAQFDGNARFLREFPAQQAKVRAIVHLSGGNPRLILMLYELLSQQQVSTIVQYLRRLVDELTPLLKHEMENLPVQQRTIIHSLMEKGGTAKPADLVGPTRLPLNVITVQLKRLKDAQIVELLGGGKGRAANYTIPDKLFAIWYQMRFLSQNRRRIELFVEVLRVWFEAEERYATVQSLTKAESGSSPLALHDAALTAEYFAASLKATPYEQDAHNHVVRQWLRAGDTREAALAYAEFEGMRLQEGFSFETSAYLGLGQWCGEHSDLQTAEQVLSPIIEDRGKNTTERTEALLSRGYCRAIASNFQGALEDVEAALALDGATKSQAASCLLLRGIAKGGLGDKQGEIADYSAVLTLEGAPEEAAARALVYRGEVYRSLSQPREAVTDWTAALDQPGVSKEVFERAARALFMVHWQDHGVGLADQALDRFAHHLASKPTEESVLQAAAFLSQLASPDLCEGWTHAARRLLDAQSAEVRQWLIFLEPVCAILEGGKKNLLDPLPPEQREFAARILARFEVQKEPAPPQTSGTSPLT